jgi:acyl carrier protein
VVDAKKVTVTGMDKQAIIEKISDILQSVLKHNRFEIHDELTATMVEGWDSLTHMIIITEIEKTFAVQFKLKEINKLKNMGNLIELIQSKQVQ